MLHRCVATCTRGLTRIRLQHCSPTFSTNTLHTSAVLSTLKMSAEPAQPAATQPPAKEGPSKSELKRMAKEAEKERKRIEREAKEAEQRKAREAADVDFATQNYGKLPLHQSQEKTGRVFTEIANLSKANAGERVYFRARVHNSRAQGAKMVFFEFRQSMNTIQALIAVEPEKVSKHMVRWADSLPRESLVLVEGVVQQPLDLVKSTTIQDAEVKIEKIFLAAEVTSTLPFNLDDASRPEADYQKEGEHFVRVELNTRLQSRAFDLRTPTNQAIFRLNSGVCSLFREYLDSQGFTEIHTAKLQGAATESGASVFKVDYFKRAAFLAQSPQFGKQMCIAGDMGKVYEIGPVFRAEDSNTHRHMTEFTGLDLEMAINEHYHEAMFTLDGMLKHIFKGLQTKFAKEIDIIGKQFPAPAFKFLNETLVLKFPEAIKLLREAGRQVGDYEDFNTETEKFLGALVREKYQTDYYILDKFPSEVRPFYTMPDPENPKLSNSYDFFMRGEEILSGAQRIHHAPLLEANMVSKGIDPNAPGCKDYVDGFRWGCPPHAGGGVGLERVVMLFLKLGNIRWATLFPRDPRSFATAAQLASIDALDAAVANNATPASS